MHFNNLRQIIAHKQANEKLNRLTYCAAEYLSLSLLDANEEAVKFGYPFSHRGVYKLYMSIILYTSKYSCNALLHSGD